MLYYPNKKIYPVYLENDNRGFILPFLIGGLAGGAAVGLTRPRPIYNVAPQNYSGFNPYLPAGNYSYSYYIPNSYNNFPY